MNAAARQSFNDAAGRLVRREVPEVSYAQASGGCPGVWEFDFPYWSHCNGHTFPLHSNGTGYSVPAEWTTYRYDVSGNMVRAENADAAVMRTYYPNGQVRTDSTRIRDFGDSTAFSQVHGIEYGYHEGRVTRVIHPTSLATAGDSADIFVYDPQTGAMSAAEDRNGNIFWFNHDRAGRLTSIRMPGEVVDSMRYDREGRTVWRRETSPDHPLWPLQHETFVYDARGKVLQVSTPATLHRDSSTFVQWYSGMSSLVMTDWTNGSNPQWQRERFSTDALGSEEPMENSPLTDRVLDYYAGGLRFGDNFEAAAERGSVVDSDVDESGSTMRLLLPHAQHGFSGIRLLGTPTEPGRSETAQIYGITLFSTADSAQLALIGAKTTALQIFAKPGQRGCISYSERHTSIVTVWEHEGGGGVALLEPMHENPSPDGELTRLVVYPRGRKATEVLPAFRTTDCQS